MSEIELQLTKNFSAFQSHGLVKKLVELFLFPHLVHFLDAQSHSQSLIMVSENNARTPRKLRIICRLRPKCNTNCDERHAQLKIQEFYSIKVEKCFCTILPFWNASMKHLGPRRVCE